MTVAQRERQQISLARRIEMGAMADSWGECDHCHNRNHLFNDQSEAGDYRYCARCWSTFTPERRKANHFPAN